MPAMLSLLLRDCSEIVADMPMLVALQNEVISLRGITSFIKSINYFPVGDRAFVDQVQ